LERIKKPGPVAANLSPDAGGWRVILASTPDQLVPTLEEAIALVPENAILELSLTANTVLTDLHLLPATDPGELADMLQLQLEKTLTSPTDEVSSAFEIIEQKENETRLLSIAAPHENLEQICAPLRAKLRLPERITLQALRVAAMCSPEIITLALWPELDETVVALVEHGKLAWLQSIASRDAETILAELPGILLAAELDGANTDFATIQTGQGSEHLLEPLSSHFNKLASLLPPDSTEFRSDINLLPANWRHEASRRERGEKLKSRIYLAAAIYMVMLLASFVYIAWLKRQVRSVEKQTETLAPRFSVISKQEERWNALAPSVEPQFFTAEILHRLTVNCKPEVLQFTAFTSTPREWVLHGEANNSDEGFFYAQALKTDEVLQVWQLNSNFQELKQQRVTLTISAKLP